MQLKKILKKHSYYKARYNIPSRMPAMVAKKGKSGELKLYHLSVNTPKISSDEALIAVMAAESIIILYGQHLGNQFQLLIF